MSEKRSVLYVDDTKLHRLMVSKLLSEKGFSVILAESVDEGIKKYNENQVDLILSDIEMPDKNGFDLISYFREIKTSTSIIMLTSSNINKHIDLAMRYDVGNILSKEYSQEQLAPYIELLLSRNFFGFEKYLKNPLEAVKVSLKSSHMLHDLMNEIVNYAVQKAGLPQDISYDIRYFLEETLTNALYHARGKTDLKRKGEHLVLEGKDEVLVEYGHNKELFGFCVTDLEGSLTKQIALKSIKKCLDIEKALAEGDFEAFEMADSGRGIHTVRSMASDFYVNIERNKKTEIIVLIQKEKKKRDNPPSLIINEV